MQTDDNNFALDDETTSVIEEQVFEQVDPLQVEKELTDQFIEMQKNMNPEDVAAHFFQMFFPHYKQYLHTLGKKDLLRVAEHAIQFPLEDGNPSFSNKNAKNAFELALRLIDCKMIMRNVIEMERVVEAQKATDEAKTKLQTPVVEETVQEGEQPNV